MDRVKIANMKFLWGVIKAVLWFVNYQLGNNYLSLRSTEIQPDGNVVYRVETTDVSMRFMKNDSRLIRGRCR